LLQTIKRSGQTQQHKFSFSSSIYIRLPSRSDMSWNHYVTTFTYSLWLAVAIAACVLCGCLALSNFSNKSNQSLSLIATVFYIPSCFCQQGQKANSLYGSLDLFHAFSCGSFLSFSFSFELFFISPSHSFSTSYSCPSIPKIYWPNMSTYLISPFISTLIINSLSSFLSYTCN
jgi:hypothetical protein